jgi:hypothetical protein
MSSISDLIFKFIDNDDKVLKRIMNFKKEQIFVLNYTEKFTLNPPQRDCSNFIKI